MPKYDITFCYVLILLFRCRCGLCGHGACEWFIGLEHGEIACKNLIRHLHLGGFYTTLEGCWGKLEEMGGEDEWCWMGESKKKEMGVEKVAKSTKKAECVLGRIQQEEKGWQVRAFDVNSNRGICFFKEWKLINDQCHLVLIHSSNIHFQFVKCDDLVHCNVHFQTRGSWTYYSKI